MKVGLDSHFLMLDFYGSKVTSDAGLFAYYNLDKVLGLFDSVSKEFSAVRTVRNIQHGIENFLRQSVYSRLAGYEDVNDATWIIPIQRIDTGNVKSDDETVIKEGEDRNEGNHFFSAVLVNFRSKHIGRSAGLSR